MVQSYSDFVRRALYGPGGYYRQNRRRVGRTEAGADFYTASTFGVFKKILAAALSTLAELSHLEGPAVVEIGNEKGAAVFEGPPPGFSRAAAFPLGEAPQIPPTSVVFSNELFDAQPFDRFRFTEGQWRFLGLHPEQKILDIDLGPAPANIAALLGPHFPEGAAVDLSLGAAQLIDQLCAPSWRGVFVAFDYGLTLPQLLANPRPTGRAYREHRALTLAEALRLPEGSFDITHHVLWDMLMERLRHHGFHTQPPVSQESFFVHYASKAFEGLSQAERRELAGLLHPANMGQAFEALIASR